jgi:prophage maintenance system killer protein
LESYDEQVLPQKGKRKGAKISFKKMSQELYFDLEKFKKELSKNKKKESSNFFAKERKEKVLEGILGNILQSTFGKDVYETVEGKAAHLLYFIIKNHPFVDGNKRTGAFAFVWFLKKMRFNFIEKISPEALTALTLLIAESNPKDKEKMIGLTLLLLGVKK